MANYRSIHTKFWTDHKIEPLSKEGKLLFLYLMTNSHRSSSGLYPITRNRAARDCSMKDEEVDEALAELAEAGLVLYDDETSTVLIINAVKYLPKSKEMRKSVVNDLIFNNSPLADELLRAHPCIRQWEEWTEEAQSILGSRSGKKEWDDGDNDIPF